MTNLFFAAALLLDSGKTPDLKPAIPQEQGLDGIYRSATKEEGSVSITSLTVQKVGAIHVFRWGTGVVGVGLRTGDTISVGWTMTREGEIVRGVTVYRIKGRRLEGSWASLPGNRKANVETLTWLGSLDE